MAEPPLSVLQDVFLVTLVQKFSRYGSLSGNNRRWELRNAILRLLGNPGHTTPPSVF